MTQHRGKLQDVLLEPEEIEAVRLYGHGQAKENRWIRSLNAIPLCILVGSTATAQDPAAIEQLHQKDVAAAKAGDTAALATPWTDDTVALPPGEQPVVGIDVIREWLKKRPGARRKTRNHRVQDRLRGGSHA
jgi:hypothetical protein